MVATSIETVLTSFNAVLFKKSTQVLQLPRGSQGDLECLSRSVSGSADSLRHKGGLGASCFERLANAVGIIEGPKSFVHCFVP